MIRLESDLKKVAEYFNIYKVWVIYTTSDWLKYIAGMPLYGVIFEGAEYYLITYLKNHRRVEQLYRCDHALRTLRINRELINAYKSQ